MSTPLGKKKLSQHELRKYMHQHKNKDKFKSEKKIESPLAKYNDQGLLTCVLCKSIVASEAVWNVHINAKQHKDNIEIAKKLKERTNNFTTPLKRPLTPPLQVSSKKPKSILKNGSKSIEDKTNAVPSTSKLPADFFDMSPEKKIKNNDHPVQIKISRSETIAMDQAPSETLPEGFFDDPKLDAKARNIEYKDPIQEEWEKFQREIKDAEGESAAIIAEDQEESTIERKRDRIDEQMENFSKLINLEKKRFEEIPIIDEATNILDNEEEDDLDYDETFDWRSKKY